MLSRCKNGIRMEIFNIIYILFLGENYILKWNEERNFRKMLHLLFRSVLVTCGKALHGRVLNIAGRDTLTFDLV